MRIDFRNTFLFLALPSMLLASCSGETGDKEVKKPEPIGVTIGTAGKTGNNVIHASGKIEASETAVISTRIMGFITGVKVRPGDRVKKGQLLVTISNGDILAKRAQAQAMVTESEAALIDAKRDYERFAQLYQQQSASAKEFENVTLNYHSVKAKTEAVRQMRKEAESMLTYSNLVAPFSGVITQRNADEGSMANPGMPILVVEQSGSYHVNTFVSERDIAKVRVGAMADMVIKSTGRKKRGTVSEVNPSSQLTGGQYPVKIRVADQDNNDLYAGMYAHVSIAYSAAASNDEDRLLVPGEALIRRDQLNGIYTISDRKTALLRWVTVGNTYGDQVEILSGLNGSEKFIISAEGKLYNGAPVSIKNADLSDNR